MSGIFKGDSIYKSGGFGGGGYKDGGQLVDGDFIKVENNAISNYDNVSRDTVNFYFDYKDGDILNSVIELTTAVNSTINVYIVKNGFYYLLGNIGGNTVNAGDDYKINIIGDSYSVEVINNLNIYPEYADFGYGTYKTIYLGGLLWLRENFKGNVNTTDYFDDNGTRYYQVNLNFVRQNFNGWRIPTNEDVAALLAAAGNNYNNLKITGTPYSDWNTYATGLSKFDAYPYSVMRYQGGESYLGTEFCMAMNVGNEPSIALVVSKGDNSGSFMSSYNALFYRSVRLCRNI